MVINFPVNAVIRTLSPVEFLYGILLGIVLLFLSNRLWHAGLRAYSSASS